MSGKINYINHGNSVTVSVEGKFNYDLRQDIEHILNAHGNYPEYVFDLSAATSLHSSGIGMLMILRQELGGAKAKIRLSNCPQQIAPELEVAGVEKLFRVDYALSAVSNF